MDFIWGLAPAMSFVYSNVKPSSILSVISAEKIYNQPLQVLSPCCAVNLVHFSHPCLNKRYHSWKRETLITAHQLGQKPLTYFAFCQHHSFGAFQVVGAFKYNTPLVRRESSQRRMTIMHTAVRDWWDTIQQILQGKRLQWDSMLMIGDGMLGQAMPVRPSLC